MCVNTHEHGTNISRVVWNRSNKKFKGKHKIFINDHFKKRKHQDRKSYMIELHKFPQIFAVNIAALIAQHGYNSMLFLPHNMLDNDRNDIESPIIVQ